MIVDTSVVMAIVRREEDAALFIAAMSGPDPLTMSAGSWVELAAVATRGGISGTYEDANEVVEGAQITIAPVTVEQARIARAAYRSYGRGTGHPASLNFGDCFSYALAKATGEPLLFKGRDFVATDIVAARSA